MDQGCLIKITVPADTWHGPDAYSIAGLRGVVTDAIVLNSLRFKAGCDYLDRDTDAVALELDPISETARVRLPDGRERWVEARRSGDSDPHVDKAMAEYWAPFLRPLFK